MNRAAETKQKTKDRIETAEREGDRKREQREHRGREDTDPVLKAQVLSGCLLNCGPFSLTESWIVGDVAAALLKTQRGEQLLLGVVPLSKAYPLALSHSFFALRCSLSAASQSAINF
ncbi:hypothetical protein Q8A73_002152 [Channa argus]|nr:hypothetical protein Q8A73_002152 [Channa argus]